MDKTPEILAKTYIDEVYFVIISAENLEIDAQCMNL